MQPASVYSKYIIKFYFGYKVSPQYKKRKTTNRTCVDGLKRNLKFNKRKENIEKCCEQIHILHPSSAEVKARKLISTPNPPPINTNSERKD